jgi:outer membrane protein OmpA-like peptidoglycan-associated protein
MAQYNEFPEGEPQDKPKTQESPQKGDATAATSWNEQISRRPERSISPEERAERQKVEALPGSIARAFDRLPTVQNVRDSYNKMSSKEKEALKDPKRVVVLTSTASHTGNAEYNQRLTQKSAEEVRRILKEEFGVKATIKIEAVGYDPDSPVCDDRFARQVHVDILPAEEKPEEKKEPKPVDKQTIKDLTEMPPRPEKYDFDKEVRERLKDIPDIIKGKMVKTILSEIGKLASTYLIGIGELIKANKKAGEMTGIVNGLAAITGDIKYGREPQIRDGKPFTVQDIKDRISPDDMKRIKGSHMALNKIMNRTGDQDLERGFEKITDAINRVLSSAHTPEQRQKALKAFHETIGSKIARQREQLTQELRRQHKFK